jgi:16S rRNA (adenine1518-N6/adenine1519-N6)-dimethyltransferase
MIKAKKRFGQNFLKDEFVLNKIKQAIPNSSNDLVEIGSGMGDLTNRLLELSPRKVIAYEIDKNLHSLLCKNFEPQIDKKLLSLVLGDVLKHWQINKHLSKNKYDLVANLPYNLGTNIVLKALGDDNCKSIIVMLQLEVAKKFLAIGGKSEFSALGVISELSCLKRSEIIFVDRASFEPAPKVDSMVIYLQKSEQKNSIITDEFKKFLKICFLSPRKKLITSLKSKYRASSILEIFKNLALNENARSHEINSLQYLQMFKTLN